MNGWDFGASVPTPDSQHAGAAGTSAAKRHHVDPGGGGARFRLAPQQVEVLLDASPDAIIIVDLSGRVQAWSRGAERSYGYSVAEATGTPIERLSPPRLAEETARKLARLARGEDVPPFETRRITKDDRLVDVRVVVTTLRDPDGRPAALAFTERDITDHRLSDTARRDAEARFRAIVETLVDAVITITGDGTIEWANAAVERVFGYRPDELVGRDVKLLMPEPYRSEHDMYLERYQRTGVKRIIGIGRETLGLRRDGTTFPIELAISEVRLDDRRLFTGAIRDITERKRQEQELMAFATMVAEKNAALEEAWRAAEAGKSAKSAFLAHMSHEIRTPLTAIIGFAEVLHQQCQEAGVGDSVIDSARTIRESGTHLLNVVNDILDFAKLEAGRLEPVLRQCSPAQIVEEVVALLQPSAAAKGLSLRSRFEGRIPESTLTDGLRLRQVLINLVGNAIKYTDSGSVEVVMSLEDQATRTSLHFDVIDTGVGLTQAQVDSVFRPFVQGDSTLARRYGGTGLGLVLSREFARLLGGDVAIHDSEPGRGTHVRATIAVDPTHVPRWIDSPKLGRTISKPADKLATPARALESLRILVAEDGPDNQRLARTLLERAGAEVTIVEDGAQCILAAREAAEAGTTFDVILMDMQMPNVSGYEATTALRSGGYTAGIVAFTAHALDGDREKCIAAGCDGYVSKPINREHLINEIRRAASHLAVAASI